MLLVSEKLESERMDNGLDEQPVSKVELPIKYDALAETHVRRKLDWSLMPLFFVHSEQPFNKLKMHGLGASLTPRSICKTC